MFLSMGGGAWSEENIGDAKIVINKVDGSLSEGSKFPVVQGDSVYLDEAVHSQPESKADLLLKDNTKVTIGPMSIVKLDRFVYSGPKQVGEITIDIARGTARFITGNAAKRDYRILTPTAAIGVRGTILRIEVNDVETRVINEEGIAIVCRRPPSSILSVEALAKKGRCHELRKPNTQATVTQTQIALAVAPANAIMEPMITEKELAGVEFPSSLAAGVAPPLAAGVTSGRVIEGADAVALLLTKNPDGGRNLILAIEQLLANDPSAIAAVVTAAVNANQDQQLALQQGVAQVLAFLKQRDPGGAGIIMAYLNANGTNPVVAAILLAVEVAQGSIGGGPAGGGFFSVNGGELASPH